MGKRQSPIGFFDSGIGGISVLKEAYAMMPYENYIYYGDNKNAPYGEKSEDEIRDLTLACGEFLYQKGVKAIVIACNTATSTTVLQLREKYKIPVISMEPAVRPAVNALKNGKVLVLATPVTVSQQRYLNLLKKVGSEERVISVGCPGLVDIIEKGDFDSQEIDSFLNSLLCGLDGEEIDSVVLGCTHYSFITGKVESYAKKHFANEPQIFDGNGGTVRQLKRVLEENGSLSDGKNNGKVEFYTSSGETLIPFFKKLFNQEQ